MQSLFKQFYCCCLVVLAHFLGSSFAVAESIKFEVETTPSNSSNILDQQLLHTLETYSVFEKLKQFVEQNFILKEDITIAFQQNSNNYFETSATFKTTPLPHNKIITHYSFLRQMHQNLMVKFPQQTEVRDRIFVSAVEKHLWLELGRILVDKYDLSFPEGDSFILDHFSTIMLLNLSDLDSEYLLDATETYLLVSQSHLSQKTNSFQSEIEMDESRYRLVVCLILGKDLSLNNTHDLSASAPYTTLLSDFSWGQQRLKQCMALYKGQLLAWHEALAPHLKEKSQIKKWL